LSAAKAAAASNIMSAMKETTRFESRAALCILEKAPALP
jgi:hypothetical protein